MPMTLSGDGTITGLSAGGLPDSSIVTADIANAAITAAKLDGAQSGSAPIYAARAWVSFNGTGTVAIRANGNVSSITDNGTGDYTVNFTTAMPDANYAVNISGLSASAGDGRAAYFVRGARGTGTPSTQTTSAVQVSSYDAAAVGWPAIDAGYICVAIFR